MGCGASSPCRPLSRQPRVFPEEKDKTWPQTQACSAPADQNLCAQKPSKVKSSAVLPQKGPAPYVPSNDVIDLCKSAEDPSKTIIELKRLKMTGFPVELLSKTIAANSNLNTIRCDINDITALPEVGNRLVNVRVLQLNINRLHTFPDVSSMIALKTLSLSSNSMTHLPESLARSCPTGLEELFINRNKINTLAADVFSPVTAVAEEGGLENKGLNHLKRLDLSDNKLKELPRSLGELKTLQKLEINKNELGSLTCCIGSLQSLLKLSLKANRLATLPASIGELVNLNELCVGSNVLKSLPPEIGRLINLEIFLCYGNELETLPKEIGGLANLKYLALQSNFLRELPHTMGQLSLLEDLQLGFNKLGQRGFRGENEPIAELPASMTMLQKLTVLSLESNEIHTDSFFVPVASALPKLRTLHLQDNLIETAVPEATLSRELKHIKDVTLHGNPYHKAAANASN